MSRSKPRKVNFTEEQLQEMERLYAEGYGCTVIGQQYGCLSWSIEQRLRKRGVVMRGTGARSPGKLCRHSHGYLVVNGKYEHRRVMEEKLGRPLAPDEVVHHINHIKDDNRPENLELSPSNQAHMSHHHSKRSWEWSDYLRAITLRERGWSATDVARALGRTKTSVRNRYTDLKLAGLIDSVQTGRKKGWVPTSCKLVCKHGHLLTPDNVYLFRGSRSCRVCSNHAKAAYKERQKSA